MGDTLASHMCSDLCTTIPVSRAAHAMRFSPVCRDSIKDATLSSRSLSKSKTEPGRLAYVTQPNLFISLFEGLLRNDIPKTGSLSPPYAG